jgi:hypothetical protein
VLYILVESPIDASRGMIVSQEILIFIMNYDIIVKEIVNTNVLVETGGSRGRMIDVGEKG